MLRKQFREALIVADELIKSGPAYDYAGYLYRGWIREHGGDGLEIDLVKASSDYKKLIAVSPSAQSYQNIARVLMKQGGDCNDLAYKYLIEGYRIRETPELDLGFAKFYSQGAHKNYDRSALYYKRAAWRGRYKGLLGLANIYRLQGMRHKAVCVDILRVLFWPFMVVFNGTKALDDF